MLSDGIRKGWMEAGRVCRRSSPEDYCQETVFHLSCVWLRLLSQLLPLPNTTTTTHSTHSQSPVTPPPWKPKVTLGRPSVGTATATLAVHKGYCHFNCPLELAAASCWYLQQTEWSGHSRHQGWDMVGAGKGDGDWQDLQQPFSVSSWHSGLLFCHAALVWLKRSHIYPVVRSLFFFFFWAWHSSFFDSLSIRTLRQQLLLSVSC